ncbi:hypothetical protein ACGFNU_05630 [Spirillospora sp. NPDC048911]|uniref:hypothetical protein n=1 Tax=Spirillospora sp. NPDC048911 TaxID=3364527 RepID=UPI00372252AC
MTEDRGRLLAVIDLCLGDSVLATHRAYEVKFPFVGANRFGTTAACEAVTSFSASFLGTPPFSRAGFGVDAEIALGKTERFLMQVKLARRQLRPVQVWGKAAQRYQASHFFALGLSCSERLDGIGHREQDFAFPYVGGCGRLFVLDGWHRASSPWGSLTAHLVADLVTELSQRVATLARAEQWTRRQLKRLARRLKPQVRFVPLPFTRSLIEVYLRYGHRHEGSDDDHRPSSGMRDASRVNAACEQLPVS